LIIKELLASKEDIPELLTYLAWNRYGEAGGELNLSLPMEMFADFRNETGILTFKDERNAYSAFMIKVLDENSPITQYREQLRSGRIKPGIVNFPSMFDIDDGRVD
jgi:hypothetical protein